MKRNVILFSIFCFCAINLTAQDDLKKIFSEIEKNNLELKALKAKMAGNKLSNKTMNNLSNPDISYSFQPNQYSQASTSEIDISQSFDFPTVYKKRSEYIKSLNEQEDIAYTVQRRNIFFQLASLVVNIIYTNKMVDIKEKRAYAAQKVYEEYDQLYKQKNASKLEYNKTKMNLLVYKQSLQSAQIELQSLMSELANLNGGISIQLTSHEYSNITLPTDFNIWFLQFKENNPDIILARQNVIIGKKNEELIKAANLPTLTPEYDLSIQGGQKISKFVIGTTIPIFAGRNTVKSQKLKNITNQYELEDIETKFENQMKLKYMRALEFNDLLEEFKEMRDNTESFKILEENHKEGQIDLVSYLQEVSNYNDAEDAYLNAEKEYQLAVMELMQWTIELW